ncbi:hypothetical protein TPHA_0E00530 [Tetrapisispora phaffii CBS 4417]|uniref:Pre-mRNA polyadenylation factor FIP1 n=1 Tax=Tetrapisispora phaffii (strain ATCC 24235 / CBS 4417 / NBRC 1672 / NRRL Y-8282 / UCD 70-5) TaxID=1071381 RepID=G8BTC0_TETPH|nr:hypothetical protein TPHA_0E00530 [Tetrapisispora phaffii CBS 4417]CCE63148.1 hypothetical protein TPHA_0E00530 [Tetrapisispora phaffii CBS 4417]
MSSGDEDDKFLYGSDEETTIANKKRTKTKADGDVERRTKGNAIKKSKTDSVSKSDESESASDSEYSDEESDSDVEFIISTGTNDASLLDSNQTSGTITVASETDVSKVNEAGEKKTGELGAADEQGSSEAAARKTETSLLDINGEGLFEGEPISSISPEVLKEKPWRQPGANLSDYFNYGFNEYTWMEYLQKQEKLKQEYNPHKILMGLMALQQQGKLAVPQQKPIDQSSSTISNKLQNNNSNNMNMNMGMNMNMNMNMNMDMNKMQNNPGHPPVPPSGFPMFGGFAPFPMPHMLQQMPNGKFPPIPGAQPSQQQNTGSPQQK